MNIELMTELEARAATHAALAEPVRLQIVDLLSVGDRSSAELQAAVGIPSNLLAHHLHVLEAQGIITRARSHGDRRRSYVHLVPGALSSIQFAGSAAAHRVVFVCTANSARSQLAAALWQQVSSIPATSAGTHPADRIDPRALRVARRNHLNLAETTPKSIDDVVNDQDLIITVCDAAHEELGQADAIHWSVPDPVLIGSSEAFDSAYDDLAHRVNELAPRLRAA